jgi:hypothetical protein
MGIIEAAAIARPHLRTSMPDDLSIFGEGTITFGEFAMRESLPLATIHQAVLEFLSGREDAVLFGAHAVNAYVGEPRMTQEVDILALRGEHFAEELRAHLHERFRIAVHICEVREGIGYRIYQVKKPKNRHLVDVRPVDVLPPHQRIANVPTVTPAELIAGKVRVYHERKEQPKGGTDWRDLALLLLAYPHLKASAGEVRDRLSAGGAGPDVLTTWEEVAARHIDAGEPDEEFE